MRGVIYIILFVPYTSIAFYLSNILLSKQGDCAVLVKGRHLSLIYSSQTPPSLFLSRA